MKGYEPKIIEAKWQKKWLDNGVYKTPDGFKGKKYVLDMFPYPSGATMHVGHLEGYVGTDIISRYLRMKGFGVLHPMGWDAFGLPAENYAIKTGIHPDKSTHDNIKTFKRQLEISGLSYDWDKEIDTSDPKFYKWTQWLFIQMFKRGLAYKAKAAVNWCPKDETVLANEQVEDGKCERCGTEVVQKELDQWFLKITAYADRLISGLEQIDWPEEVKIQQKNWIGRKEGMLIDHRVKNLDLTLTTFSAYPAWFYADSFIVIAPEHPLVNKLVEGTNVEAEVKKFIENHKLARKDVNSKEDEKNGIFTGRCAVDPFTGEEMPIWLANFALMDFGTGIIRCSAHDVRDYEFAKKYGLRLKEVVERVDPKTPVNAHSNSGMLLNSGEFTGKEISEALIEEVKDWIEKKGIGRREVSYHIRDWLISRQRYWGAPIPMTWCDKCGWQPVSDTDLPVLLPKDIDFLPHGESPIARSKEFQKAVKCAKCGGMAKPEVDTMDTYVDSSWYFIRFADPDNESEFAAGDQMRKWLPVDSYVGGGHVVQHLLFARFFWKVLYDGGLVEKSLGEEPFLKLRAPGWILGPDSRKMSKRWNNVVTPDDIVPKFGADTLRIYEMFMGPFGAMKPWSTTGVEGVYRFLGKVWRMNEKIRDEASDQKAEDILNKLGTKIGVDIEKVNFNTAVAAMMEAMNYWSDMKLGKNDWKKFILLLAPFAPHLAEEMWEMMGGEFSVHNQQWPEFAAVVDAKATLAVQVDGKLRDTVEVEKSRSEEEVVRLVTASDKVKKYLEGKDFKIFYVPGRIVNLVTRK